ncbi:MAG: acylneuraminate cytidylyltransferase family protein, partial [Chloroflexi bacterium]|nr:acylneuraminate cytidylyltransferase family protein [Chloroflexota bacterium]
MKIAIIPARGGSTRIRNKNIIHFCGKPMIAYALQAASRSGVFDKIHVSTESDEIRAVVEQLGYPIEFMRPRELADDATGLIPVLQWVLNRYREEGKVFEHVCCLMPVCPLIECEDIVKGYEKYLAHNGQHPLHSVAPFPVPVEWAYRRDDEGFL